MVLFALTDVMPTCAVKLLTLLSYIVKSASKRKRANNALLLYLQQ